MSEPEPSLADDLSHLVPRGLVWVCPVCSLYKTLPEAESSLLREAMDVSCIGIRKIQTVLRKHGILIGDKQLYRHRQECETGLEE